MRRTITLRLKELLLIALASWGSAGSAVAAPAPGEHGFGRFRDLPTGWTMAKSVPLFERELAGRKARISNLMLMVDGQPLQVNTVECKSDAHAAAVHEVLLRAHGGVRERCPREGRYAGEVMGSRYGVKAVLKQGFGRCWDFSDCFVTLCRAAGLPSRQVFGWMYGQSGHVWAEVLLEGKGWRQVDPTAGMGCDSRYVPFIASEDGAMPIVYTSAVRVAPRAARKGDP